MKEPLLWIVAFGLVLAVGFTACKTSSKITKKEPVRSSAKHAEWTRNMVLYEINVRQFSKSGTFAGVDSSLTRIKDLGVNVLWFMPIYPIGEVNRKGELGSYYSISDYKGINPEFGNIDEFKALVARAHKMGFHVILDWVGNHTSWDNKMATDHPEWFEKNAEGKFISPFDWSDVIQLNYKAMPLWDYMIDAMKYWVADVDVDGFRCDFPGLIPEKFWYKARTELEAVKPVLMLAEDEDHSYLLNRAFDMNYAWAQHHLMNAVAEGKRKPAALDSLMRAEMKFYPAEAYRLRFLTNHDENSWNGTIKEKMGDAQKAFAAYLFTIPGVPLLYNGQEANLDKRLEFFKRDPIVWKNSDLRPFYTTLCNLRTSNPALRNGIEGGTLNMIETTRPKKVIAYSRSREKSSVMAIFNFSKDTALVKLKGVFEEGDYHDIFSGEKVSVQAGRPIQLNAWGYMVLTK